VKRLIIAFGYRHSFTNLSSLRIRRTGCQAAWRRAAVRRCERALPGHSYLYIPVPTLYTSGQMRKFLGFLLWGGVAVLAAISLGAIAIFRGEHIDSIWLVLAAVCTYALGFRFYAKFIAARVMTLNDKRATPAERLRNGHDFEPTNKWILFGHHFAAIAGPGPLVGPVLAARFGYLPVA